MVLLVNFQGKTSLVDNIKLQTHIEGLGLSAEGVYCTHGGKVIQNYEQLQEYACVQIILPLKGGKGGFGAKLKTEGGKKVRPNDNMYSRDIQGRPIAYAAVERQYRQYYENKVIEDEKVKKQMAEFKVMENTLKEQNAFMKLDRTYNAKMGETEQRVSDAIKFGFKNYLQKKKNEEKVELGNQEKQPIQIEEEVKIRISNPQEHEQEQYQEISNQKQKQEEEKQNLPEQEEEKQESLKRNRPSEQNSQEQGLPKKRAKPNTQNNEVEKKIQEPKPLKMLSARDKLKSLFKK